MCSALLHAHVGDVEQLRINVHWLHVAKGAVEEDGVDDACRKLTTRCQGDTKGTCCLRKTSEVSEFPYSAESRRIGGARLPTVEEQVAKVVEIGLMQGNLTILTSNGRLKTSQLDMQRSALAWRIRQGFVCSEPNSFSVEPGKQIVDNQQDLKQIVALSVALSQGSW